MSEFIGICEQAARAAGQILLDWQGRFAVTEKAPADLVTEADLASERRIREIVLGEYPDHGFLGEEEGATGYAKSDTASPYRWIVDPLDGTTNYVHRVPIFCVSIALEKSGKIVAGTVYNPADGQCFVTSAGEGAFLNGQPLNVSAARHLGEALVAVSFGPRTDRDSIQVARFLEILPTCQAIRRFGSSALNLCYLASGRLDAYWGTTTKVWDIAAGMLMVQEAGGVFTGIDGSPPDLDRPQFAAASSPSLHGELVQRLARVDK